MVNNEQMVSRSYVLEGVGYAWAAAGIAVITYGISENDFDTIAYGVGCLIFGSGTAVIPRVVRDIVREDNEAEETQLERELNSE